jgi:phosphotriesterase-related protein
MGRDPNGLRALSEASGLNIIMATGWYTDTLLPRDDDLLRKSTSALAEQLIHEIRTGVGESRIRPGIIGEFGASQEWLSPIEERIHRASARAHRATGIPLSTHALGCDVGLDQLDLFEEEGVDLGKVAIGHCDSWPILEYWEAIANRGAYVQLDLLGFRTGPYEKRLVDLVAEMIRRNHASNLLLSHDMAAAPEMSTFGGFGLTHIADRFVPLLREAGVTEEEVRTITVANPARFLSMPGDVGSSQ